MRSAQDRPPFVVTASSSAQVGPVPSASTRNAQAVRGPTGSMAWTSHGWAAGPAWAMAAELLAGWAGVRSGEARADPSGDQSREAQGPES